MRKRESALLQRNSWPDLPKWEKSAPAPSEQFWCLQMIQYGLNHDIYAVNFVEARGKYPQFQFPSLQSCRTVVPVHWPSLETQRLPSRKMRNLVLSVATRKTIPSLLFPRCGDREYSIDYSTKCLWLFFFLFVIFIVLSNNYLHHQSFTLKCVKKKKRGKKNPQQGCVVTILTFVWPHFFAFD